MATAPAQAQARLLDLQALDTRLHQIAHARATIAERTQARDVHVQLEGAKDLLIAAQTEASDITREQTRAEVDVEAVRSRIERDQQRMDSGAVPAKELESIAHEIESLRKRQSDLEDIELEIMERLESAQAAAASHETRAMQLQQELADLQASVASQEADLDAQRDAAAAERATVAADIPADLLALYERIREGGGVGAAMLQAKTCQGCRMTLPETEISRLRAVSEDSVERCDNCRCILVRTAESGL